MIELYYRLKRRVDAGPSNEYTRRWFHDCMALQAVKSYITYGPVREQETPEAIEAMYREGERK